MRRNTFRWDSRLLLLIGLSVFLLLLGTQNLCRAADNTWFPFTLPWDDGSASFLSFDNGGEISEPIRVSGENLWAGNSQIRLFGLNF